MMPDLVASVCASNSFLVLARILLTFVFWSDALLQMADFDGNSKSLERFGLRPGWAVNAATIIFKIVTSVMIILDWGAWMATLSVIVFVFLTIPIAHNFWRKSGRDAFHARNFAMEHLSLVGGLMLAARLSHGA